MPRLLSILALTLTLCAPLTASAQSTGAADGGERPATATCQRGDADCIQRFDTSCRASGGNPTGQSLADGALALICSDGQPGTAILPQAQEPRSSCSLANPVCICTGHLGGGHGGIYQCMIDMMLMCFASGGHFQLHGINASGPDSGTVYGGCLPRR